MSFWDRIQKDVKWDKIQNEFKKNIEEGLTIIKDGGTAVSQKIEKLTDEGKKKYRVFNLNMKVQEEFAKLGGAIYDLIAKKSKNPLSNRNVVSILKKINKMETQIDKLEKKDTKKTKKKTTKKAARKRTVKKKTAAVKSK